MTHNAEPPRFPHIGISAERKKLDRTRTVAFEENIADYPVDRLDVFYSESAQELESLIRTAEALDAGVRFVTLAKRADEKNRRRIQSMMNLISRQTEFLAGAGLTPSDAKRIHESESALVQANEWGRLYPEF